MQILLDIPDHLIPQNNGLLEIQLMCFRGEIGQCSFPFKVLPKGHSDLIDRDDLLAESYCIDDWNGNEVSIVDVMTVKMADAIIEADKEIENTDSDMAKVRII